MLLLDPWQADSYKRNQSVMRSTPPPPKLTITVHYMHNSAQLEHIVFSLFHINALKVYISL